MTFKQTIILCLLVITSSCNNKTDFQKLMYRSDLNYATPFSFETIDNLVDCENIKEIDQIIGIDTLQNFLKFDKKGYLCIVKYGYNDSTVFSYDKHGRINKITTRGGYHGIYEADSFIVSYKANKPKTIEAYNEGKVNGYINIDVEDNSVLFTTITESSKIPVQTDFYHYESGLIDYEVHKVMYESFWDVKNQYLAESISNKLINEPGKTVSIDFSKDSMLECSSVIQYNSIIKEKTVALKKKKREIIVTYSTDSTTHIKKFVYNTY